jgi:hypothetical protein
MGILKISTSFSPKGLSKRPIVRKKKKKKNIELGDVHRVGCTPQLINMDCN